MERKMSKYQKIVILLLLILTTSIVVSTIIIVPNLLESLKELQEMANKMEGLLENIQSTYSEIDTEALNQSINTLAEAVNVIASIFGR